MIIQQLFEKYKQLFREMVQLTNEDRRERCVAFCEVSGSIYPTEVEVGDEWSVFCPIHVCSANGDKPIGKVHTHTNPGEKELSPSDYYGLLDPFFLQFSCLAYEENGNYYLKCAFQPQNEEYKYDPVYERLKWCLEELQFIENADQQKILKYCVSRSTQELVEKYGKIETFKI